MTLGPKFYAKLGSAITRRRMNETQLFLADSVQNFMNIVNLLSKQYRYPLIRGDRVRKN